MFKQCLRVQCLSTGVYATIILSLGQNQPMGQYLAFPPSPGPNGNANLKLRYFVDGSVPGPRHTQTQANRLGAKRIKPHKRPAPASAQSADAGAGRQGHGRFLLLTFELSKMFRVQN